ncbi:MAG: hypothetical protein M3Y67_00870 [Pseudomonadota bacterium]|nr:hypothetical protein [Pseudomonadota bacterium]
MQPNRAGEDHVLHLWSCPQCGAANATNAPRCWSCEATLPVHGPVDSSQHAADETVNTADQPAATGSHGQPTAANDAYADPSSGTVAGEAVEPAAIDVLDGRFARIGNAASHSARLRRRLTAAAAAVLAVALVVIGYPAYVGPTRVDIDTSALPRSADTALPVPPQTLATPAALEPRQPLSAQALEPTQTSRPAQLPAPAPALKAATAVKPATAPPKAAPRPGELTGDAAAVAATLGLVSTGRIDPRSGNGNRSAIGRGSRTSSGIATQSPPEAAPVSATAPATTPPRSCSQGAAALGLCGSESPTPKE